VERKNSAFRARAAKLLGWNGVGRSSHACCTQHHTSPIDLKVETHDFDSSIPYFI
jgi:hypothetical protein